MIIWITTILCLVTPAILAVFSRGIVALSFSVACIYGLTALAGFGIDVLPPSMVKHILTVATWGQSSSIDRIFQDTYYVVQTLRSMIVPALIFTAITLVFWALSRSGATYSKRLTSGLFWLVHLAYMSLPIMTVFLFRNGMPRRFIDYDDAFKRIELVTSILAIICFAGLAALCVQAIISTVKRLRT